MDEDASIDSREKDHFLENLGPTINPKKIREL